MSNEFQTKFGGVLGIAQRNPTRHELQIQLDSFMQKAGARQKAEELRIVSPKNKDPKQKQPPMTKQNDIEVKSDKQENPLTQFMAQHQKCIQQQRKMDRPQDTSKGQDTDNKKDKADGGSSPPFNQLAKWFSPELLAKASAEMLPPIKEGKILKLEEFEKRIRNC